MIQKMLRQHGYPVLYAIERIESNGVRREFFEMIGEAKTVLTLAKRLARKAFPVINALARRCLLRLDVRLAPHPLEDDIRIRVNGQLKPDDVDSIKALEKAIRSDISRLLNSNNQQGSVSRLRGDHEYR